MKNPTVKITGLNREMICHGNHNDNDNQIFVRAGSLTMFYERGNLRHLSADGHEILRMIYMAVRDTEWLTIKPSISDERFDIGSDSFSISYVLNFDEGDIKYVAEMSIAGNADSTLSFMMRGKAAGTFRKNRIGICVLHPVKETAGRDCIIGDGKRLRIEKFPEKISPHQPFTDISLMQWNIDGISCRLEFTGDIFETEDQRNWTDASFKTYCPPLKIPFPVTVRKGEGQLQAVTLKIKGGNLKNEEGKKNVITVLTGNQQTLPFIGVAQSTAGNLSEKEASVLGKVYFSHYRADIHLYNEDWEDIASSAAFEAGILNLHLELVLFFTDNFESEASALVRWVRRTEPRIRILSIMHKDLSVMPEDICAKLSGMLKSGIPGVMTCCGTNANFAQLNRARPVHLNTDLVSYSIHPQEHASDNLTLVENLEGQKDTALSAMSFSGDRNIWISPVNIQRRFNANTSNHETPYMGKDFPPQADSRQMSLFGAAWTAGSIKNLSESGVYGITYYETTGIKGIIMGRSVSKWKKNFPAFRDMIFPVYHVFRFLCPGMSSIIKSNPENPLVTDAIVVCNDKIIRMIIVNYSGIDQEIALRGISGIWSLLHLDEDSYEKAALDSEWLYSTSRISVSMPAKLVLRPYSLCFAEHKLK